MRFAPEEDDRQRVAPFAYRNKPIFFEKPLTILPVLLAIELFLVTVHVVATTAPPPFDALAAWFDLDSENTIASWFASSQLMIAGLLLFVVGTYGGEGRPQPLLYIIVGLGFVFLSADEAAVIHERITTFIIKSEWVPRFKGDQGVWIFAYALVGVILIAGMRRNLYAAWQYQRLPASLVALGFATMVAGAVLVETVGQFRLMASELQVVTEEFLEMVGGSLILCGALTLLTRRVRLDPKAASRS